MQRPLLRFLQISLFCNLFRCSAHENVIFCWYMHEQSIIDTILERLNTIKIDIRGKSIQTVADEIKICLQG